MPEPVNNGSVGDSKTAAALAELDKNRDASDAKSLRLGTKVFDISSDSDRIKKVIDNYR